MGTGAVRAEVQRGTCRPTSSNVTNGKRHEILRAPSGPLQETSYGGAREETGLVTPRAHHRYTDISVSRINHVLGKGTEFIHRIYKSLLNTILYYYIYYYIYTLILPY